MNKNEDIQLLRNILKTTQEYCEINTNSLAMPGEILSAIVEKSLELIEKGVSIRDVAFTYLDIFKLVWGADADSEKARVAFKRHKEKLKKLLSPDSDLSRFLLNNGHESLLELSSNESRGGAKTLVSLNVASQGSPHFQSQDKIQYSAISIKRPLFWVKPFIRVSLRGKSILFFLCIPIAGLIGIPIGLFLLGQNTSPALAVLIVVALYFLVKMTFVVYELMEKGVAAVPDFMLRLSTTNTLFSVFRDKGVVNGKNPKVIEIVQYDARCPKCGDLVFIERGRREYKGRYVGRCTLSPSEHMFTFDHVNKTGNSLR